MTPPTAILRSPILGLFLALVLLGLACPAAAEDSGPPSAGFRAGGAWQLEFGPLLGYYDFDPVTHFEDGLLAGLRLGARRSPHFQVEAEFTEVYTSREGTGNRARQISAALHLRWEPLEGHWSPSLMGGVAFVAFDDSEDPDSYGDAWDGGLALAYRVNPRWLVRAEWMLRFQRFTLIDPNLSPEMQDNQVQDTWARSIHLGVYYVF
jgi:hypothetical protein